jgi:hypothetical protein
VLENNCHIPDAKNEDDQPRPQVEYLHDALTSPLIVCKGLRLKSNLYLVVKINFSIWKIDENESRMEKLHTDDRIKFVLISLSFLRGN